MAGADVDVGTELRLGLPGGGAEAAKAGKRGFEEAIDLKLKLPTAGMDEAAAAVKQEPSAEKAKRPAEVAGADAEKPPAPKYVNLSACPICYSSYVVISLLKYYHHHGVVL
jgi:auxin-responsive protein IAA